MLRVLGYAAPGVVVLKGGMPVPEDHVLRDGDEVRVLRVYSGG